MHPLNFYYYYDPISILIPFSFYRIVSFCSACA